LCANWSRRSTHLEDELLPELTKNGIRIRDVAQLTRNAPLGAPLFSGGSFPMLTPLAVDASTRFRSS